MITIKILRIISGENQEKVSSELGCTVSTYNRKENGKAEFTLPELKLLAEKYNTSLDKLSNQEEFKNRVMNIFQQ